MNNHDVIITQKEGTITCDFDTAKAYLAERLNEYNGIIFTEETKKDAKNTVAELRKEKKAFSDRVKEVKAEYMKPFNEFMGQANELMDMYDKPIAFINAQVAEFERKRIKEKQDYIKNLYDEYIGEMRDILPLSRIYNQKWENATTSRKAICEDIIRHKEAAETALAAIKNMHCDDEEEAIAIYKETLDLSKAMLHISQYEAQKAEIQRREQERIRREEEERIRREERMRIEAEQRVKEAERRAQEEKESAVEAAKAEAEKQVIDSLIGNTDGEIISYKYQMKLSRDQKDKMETYLDSVGIDWELI